MVDSASSDGTTRVEDDHPRTPPARTDVEKIRVIRESLLAAVEGGATSSSRASAPPTGNAPGDGVLVAESRVEPGAPVIYRLRAARDANPERLDLDRRSLDQCCLLEGEHRLRLLNYQHNAITRISRLESVRNLVFLDLYANAVETIGGLEATPGLRVLMLGRNRVRRITGLSHLARLDVLDLHNNRVESTRGLEGLASLRILNLAGNDIAFAGDLRTLEGLAELNLRRNHIEDLAPGALPRRLKRCFLSHNPIRDASGLAPLRDVAALEELTLDGTPAATEAASRAAYRKAVVAAAPGVRVLDGDVVRVEEKSTAASAEAANARARVGDRAETAREETDDFFGRVGDERDERRSGRGGRVSNGGWSGEGGRVSIGGGCGGGGGGFGVPARGWSGEGGRVSSGGADRACGYAPIAHRLRRVRRDAPPLDRLRPRRPPR